MSVSISVTNLSQVLQQFNVTEAQFEEAVRSSIHMAGLAVETQAKKNASGRPGPNVRTGNLRRSITTREVQKGFGGLYTVDVAATMVYARAVELGHPRWKPGVKYPYLGPAANSLQANGTLARVFTTAFGSRLRG